MTLPPVRRSVVVEASPERAYAAWTDEISQWWPLATHSVFKHDNTVAFVDGELVETAADGSRTVWGTILEADPPRRLRLTWHPGSDDERGTVELRFEALGEGRTLVVLEHTGWEHYPEPAAVRENYRTGWALVLADYQDGFGLAAPSTGTGRPAASLHRPGGAERNDHVERGVRSHP